MCESYYTISYYTCRYKAFLAAAGKPKEGLTGPDGAEIQGAQRLRGKGGSRIEGACYGATIGRRAVTPERCGHGAATSKGC